MKDGKRRALIAGATGLVGHELLELLLDSSEYGEVAMLVRNPVSMTHPKLSVHQIDFDCLAEYEELFKADDVFCCLGTTIKKAGSQEAFKKVDFVYPYEMAKASKKQNVKQFLIISAMGADHKSKVFYSRVKGEVEKALRELDLEGLHIFRPSLLLGAREEFRFGEKMAETLSPVISPLFFGPFRKYRPIEGKAVAVSMYRTALEKKKGTYMYERDQMIQ